MDTAHECMPYPAWEVPLVCRICHNTVPKLTLYSFDFGWMGSAVVAAESEAEAIAIIKEARPETHEIYNPLSLKGDYFIPRDYAPEELTIKRGVIHDDMGSQ